MISPVSFINFDMLYYPRILILTGIFWIIGISSVMQCRAQIVPEDSGKIMLNQPLFESEEPLDLTIVSDFRKLIREKDKEPAYQSAEIYLNNDTTRKIESRIKSRGYSRRTYDFCFFPPILLNFKKTLVENTIFENQDKIKLVTYCKNSDINENYVLEEYLIYKLYNLLSPYSFRVRLARITYVDINEKQKPFSRYGFLIESDDMLAARNSASIIKTKLPIQDRCDLPSIDLFTLFQYMIGNTDWWVLNFHNVRLIEVKGKTPIPVPYDFDYSGAVNPPYAKPDPNLPIKTVRDRLFRGYCRPAGTYEKTAAIFDEKKEAIYSLYRNFKYLDSKQIETTLKYYDEFYDIIDNPKLLFRNIYQACELKHKHLWEQ